MKVESLSVSNFRCFSEHRTFSFRNATLDEASDRFLILGDNGAGKTTLLQAVALPLALATRQIHSIDQFNWIGFLPERHMRWGPPRIELEVSFTDAELDCVREVAHLWDETRPEHLRVERPLQPPGASKVVRLVLQGLSCRAESSEQYFQFWGRYYATQLLKRDASARQYFSHLPGVFWFDQYRNLSNAPPPNGRQHHESTGGDDEMDTGASGRVTYAAGIAQLRHYLTGWRLAQQSSMPGRRIDWLLEIENLYKAAFPGRSFAGVEPMPGSASPSIDEYFFLLNDGHRTYDIAEMSGGEQTLFPILFEFVRMRIAHSVVLIDEIDLNLHRPAAQRLMRLLPRLGEGCQFLITTHSEAVSDIVGLDDTLRLPGGSLCL
jgi:ABC-type lipoprotein export system ATPase subunit